MSFVAGILLMWFTVGVITRKPLWIWMPTGAVTSLLALESLHRWTDFADQEGWSEGLLVGGITGVLAFHLLTRQSKKGRVQEPAGTSDQDKATPADSSR